MRIDHLSSFINCVLAEPQIVPRLGDARTFDDLLERWDQERRSVRWQREALKAITVGSTGAPDGIAVSPTTISNRQRARRAVAA